MQFLTDPIPLILHGWSILMRTKSFGIDLIQKQLSSVIDVIKINTI